MYQNNEISVNLASINKSIFKRQKNIRDFHLFDVLTLEMLATSKIYYY